MLEIDKNPRPLRRIGYAIGWTVILACAALVLLGMVGVGVIVADFVGWVP